jgi:hypothetical protein
MKRKPPNYPRRTVRIAIEHLLRHPMAIADRAEHDKIIILRAGKPHRVIMKHDYYLLLLSEPGKWPMHNVRAGSQVGC